MPPTSYVRRKPLSNVQKLFLRPYFLLIIRGMFLLRSGLRFSLWALEVPEPEVRKMPLSLYIGLFLLSISKSLLTTGKWFFS